MAGAVVHNNITSDIQLIKHGVPQGSMLGPLLFILYINDLPLYVHIVETFLYADDATFIIEASNSGRFEGLSNETQEK